MLSAPDRTLLALSAFSTAVLVAWICFYSSYGLDLSDEGFYLNSIVRPFDYAVNIPPSFFGFIYHWPYRWLGGDVATLRFYNVVCTFALGWLLSFVVILRFWNLHFVVLVVVSAGLSTLILTAFHLWLLTPNYNTLTLQSLCLVMIGLLISEEFSKEWRAAGWALIGLGGWLCCMAKLTTAFALGIVILIYVLAFRRASLRALAGAAAIAFMLLVSSAHLMGGATALFARMADSAEAVAILGSGQELSRIFRLDSLSARFWDIAVASFAALVLLLNLRPVRWPHKLIGAAILSVGLLLTVVVALTGKDPFAAKSASPFLVPIFMALGAAAYYRNYLVENLTYDRIALAAIFLILPHLVALGSNGNYWKIGVHAAMFWTLSAVIFLSPLAKLSSNHGTAVVLPFAVAAQLLTASLVNSGQEKPYRQVRDLRSYTSETVAPGGGKLILSQSSHDYYASALIQSRVAGFVTGQPTVDLSGRSPTLLYMLDGRALGQPWLVGAYPGSNAMAIRTLRLESCADLAKAWLLTEPDGPRRLDQGAVLASFGAKAMDYLIVASFNTGANDGDYPEPHTQHLLKPLRDFDSAAKTCGEAKQQASSVSGGSQF